MRDHYSDMDNSRNCHTSNFVDSEKNSTQNTSRNSSQKKAQNSSRNNMDNSSRN